MKRRLLSVKKRLFVNPQQPKGSWGPANLFNVPKVTMEEPLSSSFLCFTGFLFLLSFIQLVVLTLFAN